MKNNDTIRESAGTTVALDDIPGNVQKQWTDLLPLFAQYFGTSNLPTVFTNFKRYIPQLIDSNGASEMCLSGPVGEGKVIVHAATQSGATYNR